MIEYRGYRATVVYDPDLRVFVGVLEDIPDRVVFRGGSLEELETEMTVAVDGYIDFCIEWGRPSEPPFLRDLTVRISPELEDLVSRSPVGAPR